MAGVTPAALQRMTAKASCIAWLPSTRRGNQHHAPEQPHPQEFEHAPAGACPATAGKRFGPCVRRAPASPRTAAAESSAACDTMIEVSPQALTTCPLTSVPAMKAAEPVPRAQPYSNLGRCIARHGGGQCEGIGERRDRRERSRVEHTGHQQRREASRRQQAKSNERGKRRADGEDGAKRLGEVGEPSAQRPGDEPDRRAGCEQKPKLFWHKPSRLRRTPA